MPYQHTPVMTEEVMQYLNCRKGGIYADCTLGGCGHAKQILSRIMPEGVFIGIDRDKDAVNHAKTALNGYTGTIHIFWSNFARFGQILSELHIESVDGILLDLGVSLNQFEGSGRGFSFQKDEPLDMRMDTRETLTAQDILNSSNENELADIFRNFGEERRARTIAKSIGAFRRTKQIQTTRQLAEIILSCTPKASYGEKIHPATRVFMALRIAVNRELDILEEFVNQAHQYLNPGGRLCILSFHSLEDRIVKHCFKEQASGCLCPPSFPKCICGHKPVYILLTKKAARPQPNEMKSNPMSRSARLRAVEKLPSELDTNENRQREVRS